MRVETLGDGTPDAAVVGAIHGDEPCGARAIDRFLAEGPTDRIERPVRLIVANERALSAGDRYVDADLNRSFPGDPASSVHEERLAHELLAAVDGCTTLGIHSTVSFDEPFGTLATVTPDAARVMRALPVERAADFAGVVEGRSVNAGFLNVEAGRQGTDTAAAAAYDCLLAYLRATDVLPGEPEPTPATCYDVRETIPKRHERAYRVAVENFSRVPAGTVYAETADGAHELRSERPFWPVLLSADGHPDILGYKADRLGPIGAVGPG